MSLDTDTEERVKCLRARQTEREQRMKHEIWSLKELGIKTGLSAKQVHEIIEDNRDSVTWYASSEYPVLTASFTKALFKAVGVQFDQSVEVITDPDMFCPMCCSTLSTYDSECEQCGWSFAKHVERQE